MQGRKLGKSVYVFSVDSEQGKVAHVNFVADDAKAKGLDGREWANAVSAILGGKVSSSTTSRYLEVSLGDRLEASKTEPRELGFMRTRLKRR